MSVTPAKPVLVSDETVQRPSREQALEAVRTLIAWAGDNPNRPGLIDTPKRVVDAYGEWFDGYEADAGKELSRTFEDVIEAVRAGDADLPDDVLRVQRHRSCGGAV